MCTYMHLWVCVCVFISIYVYASMGVCVCNGETNRERNRERVTLPLHTVQEYTYGVATISRLLKIICLFAEYRSLLYGSFAKDTYNFKKPTNRSHPIRALQKQAFFAQK